ncbi:MAG TPA: ATP citrate lyase citrate-binding domain-containing protein [Candidatus Saccharimonadales bacterium]|nr:ATP citrate lyase citrate-binding domain-containing protein [Candidatus Saccharimonadales bacterium]
MPRKTISEFRAKAIINEALGKPYTGWEIDADLPLAVQLKEVKPAAERFVVKVDQSVKGRFKKGLVKLDVTAAKLEAVIKEIGKKGYRWLLVEPMHTHTQEDERYLSVTRGREGLTLFYSAKGGVDVESNKDAMHEVQLGDKPDWARLHEGTGISEECLKALIKTFNDNHFVFMEINPYVVLPGGVQVLDSAVEVDDAASSFVDAWHERDIRTPHAERSQEEQVVDQLAKKSQASFSLDMLNPNGSIFLLLSGGGASVTIADEFYSQGHGKDIANYGEYSGNPNAEETYIYTSAVLDALVRSKAKKKVLFIGGAVANFTDILSTFKGLIRAFDEMGPQLAKQKLKVYVRRGGPREEEGLKVMRQALERHGIFGAVHDASTPIATAITEALEGLK